MKTELLNAYRYHRKNYRSNGTAVFYLATRALELARADVAAGKVRYPSEHFESACKSTVEPGVRYVTRPDFFGLRFVGNVEAEARRNVWAKGDDSGWFTDPHGDVFKDGTGLCRGVVYQLPGRDGTARFVAGYEFGGTDGGPTIDFGTIFEGEAESYNEYPTELDAAKDAARMADEHARVAAEREHEYQTAWAAGNLYAQEVESIESATAESRAILAELRTMRKAPIAGPTDNLCNAIRRHLAALRGTIEAARVQRDALAAGDYSDGHTWLGFSTRDESHRAAFCDAAGLDAFPS